MDSHQFHQSINDPNFKEPTHMRSKYRLGDIVYFLVSTDIRQSPVLAVSHNTDESEEGNYYYHIYGGGQTWTHEDDLYPTYDQASEQI